MSVRADEAEAARVEQVLAKYSTVDVAARGNEYRTSGWSRFDETAPAYDASIPGTMGTPSSTVGSSRL